MAGGRLAQTEGGEAYKRAAEAPKRLEGGEDPSPLRKPVVLWLEPLDARWFAVAECEGRLVATAVGESREELSQSILRCLPRGCPCSFMESPSESAVTTVRMIAELEKGNEAGKEFALSSLYLADSAARIYRAAAAIPRGYASTYGRIAAVSNSNARVVGRLMAANPLYPIVPCHRVVGADFSLVGYGGRQDDAALLAKLARLRAEARGYGEERTLSAPAGLRVFPVEWIVARAEREKIGESPQLDLW